jgi:hypothetical protein
MKKILTIIIVAISVSIHAQCNDIKTTRRPDNNTIKYFNPKPIIRQDAYEVGSAIYKNTTTGKLMVSITVLFKKMAPKDINGKLTIQTNNNVGIELSLLLSEQVDINGNKTVVALYEIDDRSLAELKKYSLKSIYFYLDGKMYGATTTENKSLFITQLQCLE